MNARKLLLLVVVLGGVALGGFWWLRDDDSDRPHVTVVTVPDVPAPPAEPVVSKPEPSTVASAAPAAASSLSAAGMVFAAPTDATTKTSDAPGFKFTKEQLEAVVAEMWEGLLPDLHLAPDQEAAMMALLQQRQVAIAEAVNAALARGLEAPRDIDAIRREADAVRAKFDEQLRQQYGDAVYMQYRAWDDTRSERNTLHDFERGTTGTPLALTEDQEARFIGILAVSKTPYQPPGIGRVVYGGMNQRARISDQTIETVLTAGIFSPEQMQHLQNIQRLQQAPPAEGPPKK